MVRLDIRRAAGQQQAVEPVEQRGAIGLRPDRRDQHRQASGDLDDGFGISFADGVKPALVDRANAGRDADKRKTATGHYSRSFRLGLSASIRRTAIHTGTSPDRAPPRIAYRTATPWWSCPADRPPSTAPARAGSPRNTSVKDPASGRPLSTSVTRTMPPARSNRVTTTSPPKLIGSRRKNHAGVCRSSYFEVWFSSLSQ